MRLRNRLHIGLQHISLFVFLKEEIHIYPKKGREKKDKKEKEKEKKRDNSHRKKAVHKKILLHTIFTKINTQITETIQWRNTIDQGFHGFTGLR